MDVLFDALLEVGNSGVVLAKLCLAKLAAVARDHLEDAGGLEVLRDGLGLLACKSEVQRNAAAQKHRKNSKSREGRRR